MSLEFHSFKSGHHHFIHNILNLPIPLNLPCDTALLKSGMHKAWASCHHHGGA